MVFRDIEGNEVDPTDFLTKEGKIKKRKKVDKNEQALRLLEDEENEVLRGPQLGLKEPEGKPEVKRPDIPMDAADRIEDRRSEE